MNPRLFLHVCWLVGPLLAQDALTLDAAVRQALTAHPSLEAAAARVDAAGHRINQARSGNLPQVHYQESAQGGNNPVYVFSSLLTQRRFTEVNFAIGSLVRPDPLANFQSLLTVEQKLWDAGRTKALVESASLGRQLSAEDRRRLEMGLIAGVARAYHGITLAGEGLKVAREALRAAEADAARAANLRAAGMATEADVLSIRVHLSAVSEQHSRRQAELEVARAALNEALGLPLDTPHRLTTPLAPASLPAAPSATLEERAASERPELRQARLAGQLAEAQTRSARAALWPTVGLRGMLEADRNQVVRRGGGNWFLGASLRWDVFDGNRARSALAEAQAAGAAARAGERQLAGAVRLEVRKAHAEARSAAERIAVTAAAIAQAEESLRIIRNRYEGGLATVTELLRADTALLEARTRRLAAVYDQRMAAIALELAAGTLTGDSDVLR
jgi:outer membrane protein TolC